MDPSQEGHDAELERRLELASESIPNICEESGNAGMSIGIIQNGKNLLLRNFGFQSVESGIHPDSDTIYHVASLTKAVTAAAIAILVDRGSLSWDDRIKDWLPDFHQLSEEVRENVTVLDLLSHRTGLDKEDLWWLQSENRLLLAEDATVQMCNNLRYLGGFRSEWIYNNWMYALCGILVEKVTGQTYADFVAQHLFEPLGLERTTIGEPPHENRALCYMSLDDATPINVPHPQPGAGRLMAAAGGMKTCVNDLLKLYSAFLDAVEHPDQEHSAYNPFRLVPKLIEPQIRVDASSPFQIHYALGWVRSELPAPLGLIGINPMILEEEMPIVGRDCAPELCLYHNGSLPGVLASVHLLPRTKTAIVVLANSMPLTDSADLVGQHLVEAVVGTPRPHDYIEWSKKTRETLLSRYSGLQGRLQEDRSRSPEGPGPLDRYCGQYFNKLGNWHVQVTACENKLRMYVQSFSDVYYDLDWHSGTTFTWPFDHEADVKVARFPHFFLSFHRVNFVEDSNGSITSLNWELADNLKPSDFETGKNASSSADRFQFTNASKEVLPMEPSVPKV
ncbi:hypothetical protein SLS55_005064 [Diplodia seriata]|uniref:Beta-lactamase-related domain-containing protein n=1 Tax=Diplodia seriata TaxID=420778 RepID=A0ABR3CFA4_9PEZI